MITCTRNSQVSDRQPDTWRRRNFLAALSLYAIASLSSCASVDSRPPLFAAADLPVTLTEFRLRLGDFNEYFIATIADASENVIDTSEDQLVRRNAMEFRLRAVNNFLNALNKPDPVAALIDAWGFCLQLVDFLEPGGAGAELFGEQGPVLLEATQDIAREVDRLIAAVSRGPTEEPRALVRQWVDENPLVSPSMIRASTTIALADQLEGQEKSAFAALGRLQADMDDLVQQYQRYISVVPRMVRWGSQLILHETLYDELDLGTTMERFDTLSEDFVELAEISEEFLANLPNREELDEALANLVSVIDTERASLLAEIDRQRGLVFDDVTIQRESVMRDIEDQIALVEQQVQGQVDEIFTRIETIKEETLVQSFEVSERLINLVYLRVFILLLVTLAGGAGLILLHKWRHPARAAARRDTVEPEH